MVIFVSGTIQADLILLCRNITNAYSCGWKFSEKPHFLEAPFLGNVMINQGIRLCLAHSEAETQRIISLST